MKKRIFAFLLAISLLAGLLPTTVFAEANPAKFTFVDSVIPAEFAVTADLVVTINQGDAPVYLKTVGNVVTADGASASDYNIKITYEAGKNPTVYLKGAKIDCLGDGKGASAIKIGSDNASDACNDLSVDIVVEEGTSTLFSTYSWSSPKIMSFATGTLTISSVNGGVLDLMTHMGGQNQGTVEAVGDILLKDANITMHGYAADPEKGYYIYTRNGNLTIDGGNLTIDTSPVASNRSLLLTGAPGKNIVIQNGAKVNILLDKTETVAFDTAGDLIINNAYVIAAITGENSKFANKAPVIEGYGAEGYMIKTDSGEYDPDKIAEYKTLSILPFQKPHARFAFKNFDSDPFELEYIIEEGDDPIYLKTPGKVVSASGATEKNYTIKITYETGKTPTIYLKGAQIATYADGKGDIALTIGSPNAADLCNDTDVNIVVERNSEFHHRRTYGSSHIMSYISGTLTITKEKGSIEMHHMMNQQNAAIQAVGDIVLKNITLKMVSDNTNADKANYIRTTNGHIILDGATINVTTNGSREANEEPTYRRILFTVAEGKNIVIQNGSKLNFNIRNAMKAFGTAGDVIIKDSVVKVKVNYDLGTIFDAKAPVIEGYAGGYTAKGDEAAYDAAKFDTYKSFSIAPVGQEDLDEPEETKPETKPTQPELDPTEPKPEPDLELDGAPAAPTTPDNSGDSVQSNNGALVVVLWICVALIVLVNGATVALVIIKKKKAAAKEKTEE